VRTASIAGNHNEIDASGLIGNRSTLLPIAGLFRARLGMSVDCIAGCNKSSQGMKIKPRQIHLLRRANDIQTIDYADF
jgi:hypothetical protein